MRHDGQFNVIHVATGLKIDFMCADPGAYNDARFKRVRRLAMAEGVEVVFSAQEDVMLKKLQFYKEGGSDKHLRDIASMSKISGESFDRAYLERWAAELGVAEEWSACKARCGW